MYRDVPDVPALDETPELQEWATATMVGLNDVMRPIVTAPVAPTPDSPEGKVPAHDP